MAPSSVGVSAGGPRLGAHMSIAGGIWRAVDRALSVRATALQVFVKSARQWAAKPIDGDDALEFRRRSEAAGLAAHTLAHASYLINIAAPDDAVRERSVDALSNEISRCEQLGIPFLVLHPGSHVGSGEEAGLRRVAAALDRVLARRRGGKGASSHNDVTVLLETTAGQGSNLGHRFEQIAFVLDTCRISSRLGVCFDTCHAFAAGYEFRDAKSYGEMFQRFDETIGLERMKAFHLNDSKSVFGSRVDRHEHIGRGEIGLDAFRMLLADRRFRSLPMVLETPKGDDLREDRRNLKVLRGLAEAGAGGPK